MKAQHDGSEFVRHIPCEKCGSSDANSLYTDGHQFCFGCDNYVHGDGEGNSAPQEMEQASPSLSPYFEGTVRALPARGILQDTCAKYGYRIGVVKGKPAHLAPYFKDNTVVGCKVRGADKNFAAIGDMKDPPFFGQQLYTNGKMIVVTEGELDAMAVAQAQGLKWASVSVPTGAKGAAKAFRSNLEYLNNFESVILFFDMDEAGQAAAIECAELLKPGKAKIAFIEGAKDANDLLLQGRTQDIIQAIWNAKPYRPDGLVEIDDELLAEIDKPVEIGMPWCFSTLTEVTYGRRYGEIYGLGAGTGVGKTDVFTQQIEYDISQLGLRVGLLMLEQKPKETVVRVAGKKIKKRLHVPNGTWTPEERREAVASLKGMVTLYDSFGQTEWTVVSNKIRYMAAQGIRVFYLDHLTAMADTNDEKGSLEQIMKEMAGLANELDIIIHFISHLSSPTDGKSHEEGGRVTIKNFKGSRSIGFWSFFMFGLERNQQAEDEEEKQTTTFRVLKDRYTGDATGKTFKLKYDRETGCLYEIADSEHGF